MVVIAITLLTYLYVRQDKLVLTERENPTLSNASDTLPHQILPDITFSNEASNIKPEKISKALATIEKKMRNPNAQPQMMPQKIEAHNLLLDTKWMLWLTARAVLSEQSTAADQIIGKLGRYNIIETGHSEIDLHHFDKSSLAVVYDSRLRRVGLITGTIKIVTLQKDELIKELIGLQANISNSFDDIHTYFVSSDQSIFDLEKLYLDLKAQSFTQRIELDISDRAYEKK